MGDQGYLFPPFSREGTSREAAASMEGAPAAVWRARVLEFIVLRGKYGATDDEVAEFFGVGHNTTAPRRYELAGLNKKQPASALIANSGKRRPTRAGKSAMVWVAIGLVPRGEGGDSA